MGLVNKMDCGNARLEIGTNHPAKKGRSGFTAPTIRNEMCYTISIDFFEMDLEKMEKMVDAFDTALDATGMLFRFDSNRLWLGPKVL